MGNNDDFIAWATNPKLNIEEAFCAEIIVEKAIEIWRHKNKSVDPERWDAKRDRHKKRSLNPVHRAKLSSNDVERAASVLTEVRHIWLNASKYSHDDRPLRDLSGFRFLTGLTDFGLHGGETTDISSLAELPNLRKLTLWDEELNDLSPLQKCEKLEVLSLHLNQPWPLFPALQNLSSLKQLEWRGNPFVLEGTGMLPHVTKAKFEGGFNWKLPLRNLQNLPEMPELRVFDLDPVWAVDGIERWPKITNLFLGGNIRDLSPLQRLTKLTHLSIKTDSLRNIERLVPVPELRYLLVDSEHPVDFSSLTDAPHLHEVEMKRCEINRMELSTLNSVFAPWDDEFAQHPPHAVTPLKVRVLPDKEVFKTPNPASATAAQVEENPQMLWSEARWIRRRLNARLKSFLRDDKWGKVDTNENGHRTGSIEINNLEAAERLPRILEIVRNSMAESQSRWDFILRIWLKADWHQSHPELEKTLKQQRLLEEHLQWEARQKERKEFLERKHRAELLQQEGMKVKAEDFAAPEKSSEDEPAGSTLEEAFDMQEPEAHPMAEQLDCIALLTENELIVGQNQHAAIKHFLGATGE